MYPVNNGIVSGKFQDFKVYISLSDKIKSNALQITYMYMQWLLMFNEKYF